MISAPDRLLDHLRIRFQVLMQKKLSYKIICQLQLNITGTFTPLVRIEETIVPD